MKSCLERVRRGRRGLGISSVLTYLGVGVWFLYFGQVTNKLGTLGATNHLISNQGQASKIMMGFGAEFQQVIDIRRQEP